LDLFEMLLQFGRGLVFVAADVDDVRMQDLDVFEDGLFVLRDDDQNLFGLAIDIGEDGL
jgi:hypothetical protein